RSLRPATGSWPELPATAGFGSSADASANARPDRARAQDSDASRRSPRSHQPRLSDAIAQLTRLPAAEPAGRREVGDTPAAGDDDCGAGFVSKLYRTALFKPAPAREQAPRVANTAAGS